MKIIVISDSHGNLMTLRDIVLSNNDAEVIIFCGDGYKDIQELRLLYPEKMIMAVRGNCDWYCDNPDTQEITLCGKKIFAAHGHLFGVKQGYSRIIQHGKSINADIVLFGHTHNQFLSVEDDMIVLNPGSASYSKKYALIELSDNGETKVSTYPPAQSAADTL